MDERGVEEEAIGTRTIRYVADPALLEVSRTSFIALYHNYIMLYIKYQNIKYKYITLITYSQQLIVLFYGFKAEG